jgi:hypothetical protein
MLMEERANSQSPGDKEQPQTIWSSNIGCGTTFYMVNALCSDQLLIINWSQFVPLFNLIIVVKAGHWSD